MKNYLKALEKGLNDAKMKNKSIEGITSTVNYPTFANAQEGDFLPKELKKVNITLLFTCIVITDEIRTKYSLIIKI